MGGALIGALIKKGICKKGEIYGTDKIPAAMEKIARDYGIRTTPEIATVVSACDFVFLSVKPQDVEKTMKVSCGAGERSGGRFF
jgi:pyrroline-5-carboxylate reductase